MGVTQAQDVTFEAICSAFYNLGVTRFLGERDDGSAWFRFQPNPDQQHVDWRVDPHFLLVSVFKDPDIGTVGVQVECKNVSGDEPLTASQVYRVQTHQQEEPLRAGVEAMVVRVLHDYQDVLNDVGLAGPIEDLAPESFAGDEDDPDDMAVKD